MKDFKKIEEHIYKLVLSNDKINWDAVGLNYSSEEENPFECSSNIKSLISMYMFKEFILFAQKHNFKILLTKNNNSNFRDISYQSLIDGFRYSEKQIKYIDSDFYFQTQSFAIIVLNKFLSHRVPNLSQLCIDNDFLTSDFKFTEYEKNIINKLILESCLEKVESKSFKI